MDDENELLEDVEDEDEDEDQDEEEDDNGQDSPETGMNTTPSRLSKPLSIVDEREGSWLPLLQLDRMEPFQTAGLREIGNLASWTVSTSKPGCGVQALRDDDTNLFWQ
jgi:anaphase-promoting complex subunit 10